MNIYVCIYIYTCICEIELCTCRPLHLLLLREQLLLLHKDTQSCFQFQGDITQNLDILSVFLWFIQKVNNFIRVRERLVWATCDWTILVYFRF